MIKKKTISLILQPLKPLQKTHIRGKFLDFVSFFLKHSLKHFFSLFYHLYYIYFRSFSVFFLISLKKSSGKTPKSTISLTKERNLLTKYKNERILFENLSFFQRNLNANLDFRLQNEQTLKFDYKLFLPNEKKNEKELKFLYLHKRKTTETFFLEFELIKQNIIKYLLKYKEEIGQEMFDLSTTILENWQERIYAKINEENQDLQNNLNFYSNLNTDKTVKIKIEHSFSNNFFKNERKFAENLIEFSKILKLNNKIIIGEFNLQEILKKLQFLKSFVALSFFLVFELKINAHNKKISLCIFAKICKHFAIQTFETQKNFIKIAEFMDKFKNSKTILPCSFAMNLSKSNEKLLGLQFFENPLIKDVLWIIEHYFKEIKRNKEIIKNFKTKTFIFEVKFDDLKVLEWEIFYVKKKDYEDELIKNVTGNRKAEFVIKNLELCCETCEIGLNYASNYTYFVKKIQKIKQFDKKIEGFFDKK